MPIPPRHVNPPRPCASKRVDAATKQTSQNLQTNLLRGKFTLPLPPPRPLGSDSRSRLWRTRGPLEPSKCFDGPILGPIKAVMLTPLPQKNIILTMLMPKKHHWDDFSMKKEVTGIYLQIAASIYRRSRIY